MTTVRIGKLVAFIVSSLLAAIIFISFILDGPFIHDELVALDLIPKPETLTELYFNADTDLPRSATSNQVVRFAFVIHNLEATDYQYTYEVSLTSNGTKHIVDFESIVVNDNHYYTKNEKLKLTSASGRNEITVDLINKQQSIHFWIGAQK